MVNNKRSFLLSFSLNARLVNTCSLKSKSCRPFYRPMDVSLQFPVTKTACPTPHHGVVFYNFAGLARPIALRFDGAAGSTEFHSQPFDCSIPALSLSSFRATLQEGSSQMVNGTCPTISLASTILQHVFEYQMKALSDTSNHGDRRQPPVDGDPTGRRFVNQLLHQTSLLATVECQDCRPPPPPTAASVRRQYNSPYRHDANEAISLFRPFSEQERRKRETTFDELNQFVAHKLRTTKVVLSTAENKQREADAIELIEHACSVRSRAAVRKSVVLNGSSENDQTSETANVAAPRTLAPTVESLIFDVSPFSYCRADEVAFHTSVKPSSTDGATTVSNAVYVRGHYVPMSVFDAAHLFSYCAKARSESRLNNSDSTNSNNAIQQYFIRDESESNTPIKSLQCAYAFSTRKVCPIEVHIDSLSGTRLWIGTYAHTNPNSQENPATHITADVTIKRSALQIGPSSIALHPPPSLIASRSHQRSRSPSSQRIRAHPLLAALSIGRVVDHLDFVSCQEEPNYRDRILTHETKYRDILYFEFARNARSILLDEKAIRTITGLQGHRYKRRFFKDLPPSSPPVAVTTLTASTDNTLAANLPSATTPSSLSVDKLASSTEAKVVAPSLRQAVATASSSASQLVSSIQLKGRRKVPKRQPTPQELRDRHRQRQLAAQSRH